MLCRERWQVRNGPNCYRDCWLFGFLKGLNLRRSGKGSRHRRCRQWRHHDTPILRSVFHDLSILLVIHVDMLLFLLLLLLLLCLFVFVVIRLCKWASFRDCVQFYLQLLHAFLGLLVFLPFSIPPRTILSCRARKTNEPSWTNEIVKYFRSPRTFKSELDFRERSREFTPRRGRLWKKDPEE
jgi:hypothetical protein